MRTTLGLSLALAASIWLVGCAGPSVLPSVAAASTPPALGSSEPAGPADGGPAARQPGGAPFDPCQVATAGEVSEVIKADVREAVPAEIAGTSLCTYVTAFDAPQVIAQTGALAGDLRTVAQASAGYLADATVTDTRVAGADSAVLVTGTLAGAPGVLVLAASRGVYIQVVVSGAGTNNETYANQITGILVAG